MKTNLLPTKGPGSIGHSICLAVFVAPAGVLLAVICASPGRAASPPVAAGGALDGVRYRVVVTSDIGGTDPDDFQSMAHLLLYADVLEIEGLVSSPFDKGGKEHILQVIDAYERDYPNLRTYSEKYPTADALRAITRQGGKQVAPYSGLRGTSLSGKDGLQTRLGGTRGGGGPAFP